MKFLKERGAIKYVVLLNNGTSSCGAEISANPVQVTNVTKYVSLFHG